jgi:hypothetical protein
MIGIWPDHVSRSINSSARVSGPALPERTGARGAWAIRSGITRLVTARSKLKLSAAHSTIAFISATPRAGRESEVPQPEQQERSPSVVVLDDASVIKLTNEYQKMNAARAVPGAYWDREGTRYWVVDVADLTPRAAMVISKLFPDVAAKYPEVQQVRDRVVQDVRPFDEATKYNKRIGAPNVRETMEKLT